MFRLSSEKLDRLLAEAGEEADPQEGYRLYEEAEGELEQLCVFVPLARESWTLRVSYRVDRSSLPQDMTEYYGWYSQAYAVRMK